MNLGAGGGFQERVTPAQPSFIMWEAVCGGEFGGCNVAGPFCRGARWALEDSLVVSRHAAWSMQRGESIAEFLE